MNRLIDRAELFNRLSDVKDLAEAMAVIQDMPEAEETEKWKETALSYGRIIMKKWTPVSEKEPVEDGEYIVTIKGAKYATFLFYDAQRKQWWDESNSYKVEAWMPLPEAYKEEKHETE